MWWDYAAFVLHTEVVLDTLLLASGCILYHCRSAVDIVVPYLVPPCLKQGDLAPIPVI